MSRGAQGRPGCSRSILRGWRLPEGESVDERPLEWLLERARRAGTIHQYDTGRGNTVWFEGPPGRDLRALTFDVRALLPVHAEPLARE